MVIRGDVSHYGPLIWHCSICHIYQCYNKHAKMLDSLKSNQNYQSVL
jgi:hypothetical protein